MQLSAFEYAARAFGSVGLRFMVSDARRIATVFYFQLAAEPLGGFWLYSERYILASASISLALALPAFARLAREFRPVWAAFMIREILDPGAAALVDAVGIVAATTTTTATMVMENRFSFIRLRVQTVFQPSSFQVFRKPKFGLQIGVYEQLKIGNCKLTEHIRHD